MPSYAKKIFNEMTKEHRKNLKELDKFFEENKEKLGKTINYDFTKVKYSEEK